MMDYYRVALATCGAIVAYVWYKRYHALSISDVPGPKNPSRIYGKYLCVPHISNGHYLTDSGTGHMWWWQREGVSIVEKRILEEYGTVARWNGALGVCSFPNGRAWGRY